jgi:hypothetical protein
MTRLSVRQMALYAPQQYSRHSITLAVAVFICRPQTSSHSTDMCCESLPPARAVTEDPTTAARMERASFKRVEALGLLGHPRACRPTLCRLAI